MHAGRLDATGRLFSVDTLTFNESTLKFPQIQATLVIDAFVYGGRACAGSGRDPDDHGDDYNYLDHHDRRRAPERRVRDRSSLMAKKHVDPLKAKQKKQKIIAAVLGVLFLGVLAFQVPRVMKHDEAPPHPHAMDSTTTTTPARNALAGGTDPPRRRGAGDDRPSHRRSCRSPGTPTVEDGQLVVLQPLREQRSVHPAAQRRAELSRFDAFGFERSWLSRLRRHEQPAADPEQQLARPGSAVISVNGTLYTVATDSDFPTVGPALPSRLTSWRTQRRSRSSAAPIRVVRRRSR